MFARFRVPEVDAEDLLQQALLSYLYKREGISKHEAWLIGALRKACLQYWRTRRRRFYYAVDEAILETLAEPVRPEQERCELLFDLECLLAKLPNRCRSLLRLRYQAGCDPAETAERLGYKPSGIHKILDRCMTALSQKLVSSGLATGEHNV